MQLFVRNVTTRVAGARAVEPTALVVVAVLLLAIAAAQYRSVLSWQEAEADRAERRWSGAADRAAGLLNASVSNLYASVVAASQRNELGDAAALSDVVDRWRTHSDLGWLVSAASRQMADADGTMPYVASWVSTEADTLPALVVRLPAGRRIDEARFVMAPRACDGLRSMLADARAADALPQVEIAIVPAVVDARRGCASSGYDARRAPEATAAVFRLGLPRSRPDSASSGGGPAVAGVVAGSPRSGLPASWELRVQRRGESLADALERSRHRTLWAAGASEVLLLAAVVVIAAGGWGARRRAQAHLAFAAAVAHELRTPLAALKVLGQNQARGIVAGELQLAQYGHAVAAEADRLHAFVERVLQFASGRAGAVPAVMAPLDCERLVETALAPLRDRLGRAGIEVHTRLPVPPFRAMGDEPSVVLALRNLLQNVLDHADGARHVELTIAARGRALEFTVADDGAGVPAGDRRSLFKPFVRGRRARERRVTGHGLGLAIVADVAARHHGVAWFESADGRTTFGFRLRLDAESRVAA